MNNRKPIPLVAAVLGAIFVIPLCISCEPTYDLAVTLEPPTTSEPAVESVIGDISLAYPVVPDDGKSGGTVIMPQSTAAVSGASTPAASATTVSQGNYKFEMSFRQTDPQKYGEVIFTARATSKDVVKVNLTGADASTIEGPAWHEVYMDKDGVATTSWNVSAPGEYTASGWLMTSPLTKFTVKLTVK
jgi:hypothetical protein